MVEVVILVVAPAPPRVPRPQRHQAEALLAPQLQGGAAQRADAVLDGVFYRERDEREGEARGVDVDEEERLAVGAVGEDILPPSTTRSARPPANK